jgi:predicted ribosome quality control (RQC) complex YloA/Tae2 family protein
MALDGALLSFIKTEINEKLADSRVDKVQQPEKDELFITMRKRGGTEKLLMSASSNNPRVQLTSLSRESPLAAPMFCMLLRKHLSGARFLGASQPGLERILFMDFECRDELGDIVKRTLAAEIMGRHSNIMLLDAQGRIIDSIKRVDASMSSKRQVLPGLRYELPPKQDKTDLTAVDPLAAAQMAVKGAGELDRALIGVIQGVSPIVCRELAQLACRSAAVRAAETTPEQVERLAFFIGRLSDDVKAGRGRPVLVSDAKTGKPMDFSFMDITQYGSAAAVRRFDSFSELLDAFYTERDRAEQTARRTHDILTVITGASDRVSRKLASQRSELLKCADREQLRMSGDLLSANIYRLNKGMNRCSLENFYESDSPLVEIKLDPRLTPSANAQKYYREYRRAATREKMLREQTELDEKELAYLDTVFDELSRAGSDSELAEIRDELAGEGYVKKRTQRETARARSRENAPLKFRSADGFDITVGRNNRQNDRLTLRTADKRDIWLHTKNIPGAHVIISTDGGEVPDATILEAAVLAACHSKARESSQVPVDFTQVKNVKKPAGAKPGMVIYDEYNTVYVKPDAELIKKLSV